MKQISTLIFLLFLGVAVYSQQNDNITISGTVTNQHGEPLPYANVAYASNLRGTVCNGSGQFELVIPEKYLSDNLTISFLGYDPLTIPIRDVRENMRIRLKESALALNEAVIEGYTGRFLINKAIGKIPENHQGIPYINTGFYRLTTNDGEKFIHLSEAVFDICYTEKPSTKNAFRLNKMRALKDESAARGITVGQSPETLLSSDIVNYHEDTDLLSKKGLSGHKFLLEGLEIHQGVPAYKISFEPIAKTKKGGRSGHLFLEKSSLAFLSIHIGIAAQSLEYIRMGNVSTRAMMSLVGMNMSLLHSEEVVTYKKSGNKYFLRNVSRNSSIRVYSERENYDFTLDSHMDYAVTETILNDPREFNGSETMNTGRMIESQEMTYDSAFWKDYTIILPDQDFAAIARDINARNSAHDEKKAIMDVIFKYPKDKQARTDSILTYYNRKGLFNGNALVALDGKTILSKSYNNDRTGHKPSTRFRIGSVSKTFTATLIMLLAREKKLSTGDPVSKFIPDYLHGEVTISQLLSHTSGIPDLLNDGRHLDKLLVNSYTTDELIKLFCSDSPEFSPGESFDYSNSGYVILAGIIEKITGRAYHDALQEMILRPLGMKNTYFGEDEDSYDLATGYLFGQKEADYPISNVVGAGGITSTTEDLLIWSRAQEDDQFLSLEERAVIRKARADYTDWEAEYGYGWMIDKSIFDVSKKHQVIYHPGTDNGFHAMLAKQPDKEITIILLNNTGAFPRFDITDLILRELDR